MTGNIMTSIKIIQRIMMFMILVIILDFLVGSGLEYLYFKQKVGLYARTTYGLEQTTAELLIFGSSSANHHYNPSIFEKTLNLSAYNEGRDGIEILYHAAILNGILRRHTPKVIILNLAPNELTTELGYDRLAALLPYYEKYPEMKEIISLKSKFENWKLFSKIYPYNSSFLTILNGIHRMTSKGNQDNGFVPIFGSIDTINVIEEADVDYPLDSNRVNVLTDFIDECRIRQIKVYLFFSPFYCFNYQESGTMIATKSIAEQKGVFCYSFIGDPRFKGQSSLFKDNGHLNHDGATKFSEIVSEIILKDLEIKQSIPISSN